MRLAQHGWVRKKSGVEEDAMIKSFKSKETEDIFRARPGNLRSHAQRAARRAWRRLDRAKTVQDLGMPFHTTDAISSDDRVLYNISVSNQCRICFEWRNGNAYDVEGVVGAGRSSETRTNDIERECAP